MTPFIPTRRSLLLNCAAALALAASGVPVLAAPALAPPPSSLLTYELKASAKGFKIDADSRFEFERKGSDYRLVNSGKFMFFSFAFESTGKITDTGLAPARYQETRNKRVKTVTFNDAANTVTYSGGGAENKPAGIQDRMSVLVQLAAMGQADPKAFEVGKVASFRVAGSSRADNWRFKAVANDTLQTALGPVKAVHLVRERDHDDGQKVEVWVAADYDWMPVRVLSNETDGDYLDQVIKAYERR